MAKVKVTWLLPCLLLVAACGTSNCKKQENPNFFVDKTKDLPEFKAVKAENTGLGEGANVWIQVYKADGSLQCGMGTPIAAEAMSKELTDQNIKVRKTTKGTDGLMRIQVCGSPSGRINIFEIQEANKKKAQDLGFQAM